MKFNNILALSCAVVTTTVSAFTIPNNNNPAAIFDRTTSIVLEASRAAQKKKSRLEWCRKRGFDNEGNRIPPEDGTTTAATAESAAILKNSDDLEYVKLVSANGSSAEVYLFGGVVTSYKDAEGTEFIAVRPDAKMDGSKPISGGLSHCWPQFGPGEIQQHGFARNVNWSVDESSTKDSVVLQMTPSDYTKEIWDKPFACKYKINIKDDRLDTEMIVDNTGSEAWAFQAALHSYFKVSSLDKLEIAGSFKGKEFLNKMVGDEGEMQTEERDSITITEEYDRVYKGVNDPVLKDSGTGKNLSVLNTEGWEDTVLWNPFGSEAMGYNNFVCVESVKFDSVSLEGGKSWTGKMTLQPSKNE
mmetsp:Transcript_11334/g.12977  ORF Transcript_11334/g.12977 Transcript_11334/m.12977 type:complete len:358 (+) Transcript_11334:98-1171(+)